MSDKKLHAHGCTTCGERYEDGCPDIKGDGKCTRCRGGKPFQLLIENRWPRECCLALSRHATKDEKKRYSLAGSSTWFICSTCKRTFPRNPNIIETRTRT